MAYVHTTIGWMLDVGIGSRYRACMDGNSPLRRRYSSWPKTNSRGSLSHQSCPYRCVARSGLATASGLARGFVPAILLFTPLQSYSVPRLTSGQAEALWRQR
jgi:hypothetical protein